MNNTNTLPNAPTYSEKTKYRKLTRALSVVVLILAIVTASVPGVLMIMRRADVQVALGNAKSLRLALQVASSEAYAAGRPFGDASSFGGVTREAWRQVITDSRVPGDFWVLQTDESGYEVLRFLYQEGDFMVSYTKEPLTYEVYYGQTYIQTEQSAGYGSRECAPANGTRKTASKRTVPRWMSRSEARANASSPRALEEEMRNSNKRCRILFFL